MMHRRSFALLIVSVLAPAACEEDSGTVSQRSEAAPPADVEARYFRREELLASVQALRKRLGQPINSLRLEILPDRVVVQAQDPVHPLRVEQFEYQDGRIEGPLPVRLKGPGTLEPNLFPLADVPLDAIEAMVAEAVERVDEEHGTPARLIARRDLPHSSSVRMRLFVTSPTFDGHVDFDEDGVPMDRE